MAEAGVVSAVDVFPTAAVRRALLDRSRRFPVVVTAARVGDDAEVKISAHPDGRVRIDHSGKPLLNGTAILPRGALGIDAVTRARRDDRSALVAGRGLLALAVAAVLAA